MALIEKLIAEGKGIRHKAGNSKTTTTSQVARP
jgi:hypothetical protein